MLPVIEREVVDRKKWITKTVFTDIVAVTQTLPGVIAVNIHVRRFRAAYPWSM